MSLQSVEQPKFLYHKKFVDIVSVTPFGSALTESLDDFEMDIV